MRRHPTEGWTLIELLIVVVICGILLAIAIPRFRHGEEDQMSSLLRKELQRTADAQETYRAANRRYAADPAALKLAEKPGITITIAGAGLDSGTGWNAVAQSKDLSCYLAIGVDTVVNGVARSPNRVVCEKTPQ